ncbi:MAG: hypothetical protein LBC92_05255 [Rickettsiales bacterium]|jgi:exonuclease VII small subunit|nr:hypothetical protein [Rickettsiales bacterium]
MIENIEKLSFDEAMDLLENKMDKIEKAEENDEDTIEVQVLYEEALQLKDYCAILLDKEKQDIIKMAKENNIPLDEIGLSEDE